MQEDAQEGMILASEVPKIGPPTWCNAAAHWIGFSVTAALALPIWSSHEILACN